MTDRLRLLGLIFCCSSLHFSCGNPADPAVKPGFTRVTFGGAGGNHLKAAIAGGLIVYALREDGGKQAVAATNEFEPISMTLPNGRYTFYAIGWGSANLLSASPPTTNPRCASSSTYLLDGKSAQVNLDMTANNCVNQPGFAPAAAQFSGTFAPLKVVLCNTSNGLAAATAGGNCQNSTGPYIGSFKVSMLAYGFTPGGTPAPTGAISSSCFVGPNEDGSSINTSVYVPASSSAFANSPFAVSIDLYPQNETCAGSPTRYIFPNGLSNGTASASTNLVGDGSGNLSLFINSNTQFTFSFSLGQSAIAVLGQVDFTSSANGASATLMNFPNSVAVSPAGKIYVADWPNFRVLGYDNIPSGAGIAADFAIGQGTLASSASGNGANQLSTASGVAIGSGKLLVADQGNNRVVIHNTIPTGFIPTADVVVGAAGFGVAGSGACTLSSFVPQTGTLQGGRLLIADYQNHRVLVFNSIPATNGASADLVLGNVACTPGTNAQSLDNPRGVWTDGTRVAVTDTNNHRVLIWNSFPTSNSQAPDIALGQTSPNNAGYTGISASGLYYPHGIWSNGKQFAIADNGAHRVLIWNSFPTTNNQPADMVLGQTTFFGASQSTTASTFNGPMGLAAYKDKFLVTDFYNNRVLIFQSN